jgi:hypothetical protein
MKLWSKEEKDGEVPEFAMFTYQYLMKCDFVLP